MSVSAGAMKGGLRLAAVLALFGGAGWAVYNYTLLGEKISYAVLCAISGQREGGWENREWVKRAEAGDAAAAAYLGYRYASGRCVAQDFRRAAYYLTQAAEAGNVTAMLNLYHSYNRGEGVAYDRHKAQDWLLRAAKGGENHAQYLVGASFARGARGFAQDGEAALKWFSRSAEQGHPGAFFSLGYLRRNGKLGDGGDILIYPQATDYDAALKYLRLAAAGGNPYAMAELAEMFAAGEGVAADPDQAREWMTRALAAAENNKMADKSSLLARKRALGF